MGFVKCGIAWGKRPGRLLFGWIGDITANGLIDLAAKLAG
jgi:hypothetical protein